MSPAPDNTSGTNRVNSRRGRSLKLSSIYHASWGGSVQQAQAIPATAVAAGGATAIAGPNIATKSIPLTGALCSAGNMLFDVPRNVVVVVTHGSAVVALTGIITGLDLDGQTMTETFSITAGGTTKTHTGLKAFKTVTDVSVTAVADATADAIQVGSGNVLGLEVKAATILPQIAQMDGAAIATTGLVAGVDSSPTADPRGTWLPATVPNAAHTYDLWYISDDPWNS